MNIMNFCQSFFVELWNLFSVFNGNHQTNTYTIGLSLGMFFSAYLFMIIKMRTISAMDKKHIVVLIGSFLIFFRYMIMFIFEWGYEVKLYNDPLIKFLIPPVEHYFYMIGLGCVAYYSLNYYRYYPGLLEKILYAIPISITAFFIYATILWKVYFVSHLPQIMPYYSCDVDWQSHAIISIMALYVLVVSMIYRSKEGNHCLTVFWTLMAIEHISKTILYYQHIDPQWSDTLFHAVQIWSLPLLSLHFIKKYVIKLKYCERCVKDGIVLN